MTPADSPRRSTRVAAALRTVAGRGRHAAALALLGATLLAGPLPAAEAASSLSTPGLQVDVRAGAEETALADGLAAEYAGAVPARDVASLVQALSSRLRAEDVSPQLLLRTAEAMSRRSLTDHLARGVPLPQ